MDVSRGSGQRVSSFGLAALAAAVAVVLAFLLAIYRDDRKDPEIVILDPQAESTIVVSVEGAVGTPGVYDLPGDARVRDAIETAGGARDDADLRDVNLARRLRDEERLVVPRANIARSDPAAALAVATPNQPTGLINLNVAAAADLETLPGIGPALADRIVAYRNEHGAYRTVDELEGVEGISARMVEELRPLVTVDP